MCHDLRKEIMSVFSHISKRVCPPSKEFHLFRAIYTRILLLPEHIAFWNSEFHTCGV